MQIDFFVVGLAVSFMAVLGVFAFAVILDEIIEQDL